MADPYAFADVAAALRELERRRLEGESSSDLDPNPGVEAVAQAMQQQGQWPGAQQGFQAYQEPPPQAEARSYDPSYRDRTAGVLLDWGVPRNVVQGTVGSTGLGYTGGAKMGDVQGPSLLDLSGIGSIPFALDEAERAKGSGDVFGAALDTVSALPILGGVAKAAKPAAEGAQVGLGAFKTTTPGRIVNETKAGGYSVNVPSGTVPTEGFFAGTYRNDDTRNSVLEGLPTRADVRAFFDKNAQALQKPDAYFGTWFNKDDGKTYIDLSRRFEPDKVRAATKFAERTAQKKIFDRATFSELPVGNWDEFIRSPEFRDRMEQMRTVGRDYLSQQPNKDWWNMKGTAFERIYGPENMPQVAGFSAATAPVSNPRENMQAMSEYMRRHIAGEPIIQPDFRLPETSVFQSPGTKMRLETGRVANLEKAARGDIDALQLDKVRNEGQAMMGDPDAVVLDRHWARLGEDPARGIYVSAEEGVIRGPAYNKMKSQVAEAASAAGQNANPYSAEVWTGIRETIKNTNELFGTPYKGAAIGGESKSYADHLDDLVKEKAAQLGIEPAELESRLRRGSADLLSFVLAAPVGAAIWQAVNAKTPQQAAPATGSTVY